MFPQKGRKQELEELGTEADCDPPATPAKGRGRGLVGTPQVATRTKEALQGTAVLKPEQLSDKPQAFPERGLPRALRHTALVNFRAQGWAPITGPFLYSCRTYALRYQDLL